MLIEVTFASGKARSFLIDNVDDWELDDENTLTITLPDKRQFVVNSDHWVTLEELHG